MKSAAESRASPTHDAIRGILILLVMFGHVHIVQDDFRPLYNFIYIFHVAAFLSLPFLVPSPAFARGFLLKRFVRYAVPFVWFYTFATLMFAVVYLLPAGHGAADILGRWLTGLLTASTRTLDAASGLKLFWFLPTLFTLVVLRALYSSASQLWRHVILASCLVVNLMAGDFGPWRYYIPWGLTIAAYIFPVALLAAWLFQKAHKPQAFILHMAIILLAPFSLLVAVYGGVAIDLGDQTLYGILGSPLRWFLTNFAMVNAITAVFLLGRHLQSIPGLAFVGGLSLVIYLVHPFINQAFELAVLPHLPFSLVAAALVQFIGVATLSLCVSWLLQRMKPVSLLVFPRDAASLKKGCKCLRMYAISFK